MMGKIIQALKWKEKSEENIKESKVSSNRAADKIYFVLLVVKEILMSTLPFHSEVEILPGIQILL